MSSSQLVMFVQLPLSEFIQCKFMTGPINQYMGYLLTWRDRLVTPTIRKTTKMMLSFMEDTNKNKKYNIKSDILLD